MLYLSTRGGTEPVSFREAMLTGLAPDGGLFIPEEIPKLPAGWTAWDYPGAVSGSLQLCGAEDVTELVKEAAARFSHPEITPIVEVGDRLVLELFWGPTLSFKDHALQVVARLLAREVGDGLVLGATSGDTGSAAIEACRGSQHLRIVILYPDGMVSEFQRRQMTTVPDDNVTAVAVRGTFDDCQALVKQAFSSFPHLLAINSINWARVAAQAGYYLHAAARMDEPFDVAVPAGNFGNAYSCWLAKQMGAPIETITIANNSNHGLADLVNQGTMRPADVVATTAPAMDIQVPSNLERFSADPSAEFKAGWSDDRQIAATIAQVDRDHGYLFDPHTATAWRTGSDTLTHRRQLVVATAHPAKFADTVASATGRSPDLPPGMEDLSRLEERMVTIGPDLGELAPLL